MAMAREEHGRIVDYPDEFEVCIIGSGIAGTVLGRDLVSHGVKTAVLESGTGIMRWLLDGRMKRLAAYTVSGDIGYPTERTKARLLGGNSNFWTGRCERYHPSDLQNHPYTPPGNPWPLTYEELVPHYERAERTLRVRGGEPSAHAAPRRNRYPIAPRTDISGLQAMFARVGVTLDDSPTATPAKALRFFRVQKEILPAFTASRHATLLTNLTVTRLEADGQGRIVGAQARSLEGKAVVIRARVYVVACGGIETPRLLLLSRSPEFPNGIGNRYGRVGRGFNEHPGVNFYARIRHQRETLVPRHKIARSHQFYDQFRKEGLGSVLPVVIQSWVFPHHLIRPKLSDLPKSLASLLGRTVRPTLYIGATIEMLPDDDNRVTLSGRAADMFGSPLAELSFSYTDQDRRTLARTRELILDIYRRLDAAEISEAEVTWSRHHIGTCRMGSDPKSSVTDPTLRVHDSPNLYLCGSETFPTGAAVPPVLTIVALAHRLSDHLAARLRHQPASGPESGA